ncbi:MAG TPA: ABC transporter substrate-binding protein [Coriobacteriia bacterium]|nr:ABC transporter substrate-binding protein [Coriobacteriia bacterium]
MRPLRAALVGVLALTLAGAVACAPAEPPDPGPQPRVSPPVILEEGVLRVGIDFSYPPYAGRDEDREAGIDVDVASALASELALEPVFVEVAHEDAAEALQRREVDIVMSVPFTEAAVLGATFAGWYTESGPALFASEETTVAPQELARKRIAVQRGSAAFWDLAYEYGEDGLLVTETLRGAFEALEAGEADVVAGDALVSAYIARGFEGVRFAGQLEPATPIGIVVSPEATDLEPVIREALDVLAAGGVLDAIRAKWVYDLPPLDIGTEIEAGAANDAGGE